MAITLFSLLASATLILASPVPAGSPTGPCLGDIYRSQPGDTCETIGKKYNAPASAVKLFNNFVNCNDIWAGTSICLDFARPAPAAPATCDEYYVSKPGDTCESIARLYGVTVDSVKSFNDWVNCNDIWPNTRICAQFHVGTNPETTPPPSTPEPSTCTRSYVAKAGDTCTSIAKGDRLYAKMIYDANPSWFNCNDIWAGTNVCLGSQLGALIDALPAYNPPQCAWTYIALPGNTCKSIARETRRGLGEADIKRSNEPLDCNNIPAWKGICVPQYTAVPNCFTIITARTGQSCNSLSQAWKVGVEQLKGVNAGLDCGTSNDGGSNLVQDQEVCIPWSLHL